MKALLIIAHGSRRKIANVAVQERVQQLLKLAKPSFDAVECAFLQFTSPSPDDVIAKLSAAGFVEIRILPFFLAPGKHVETDLPRLLQQMQTQHPAVKFCLTPHLGELDGLNQLILTAAESA